MNQKTNNNFTVFFFLILTLLTSTELFGGKTQLSLQNNKENVLKSAIKHTHRYKTRSKARQNLNFKETVKIRTFKLSDEESNNKRQHCRQILENSNADERAKLIVKDGMNYEVDEKGYNYVHKLSAYSYGAGLRILLENSDNVASFINEKTGTKLGASALHIAVTNDLPDTIKILLYFGATIQQDADGNTPLHYAAYQGYTDSAKKLLKAMTPNQIVLQAQDGHTALSLAQHNGHKEIVNLINERLQNYE